MEIKEFVGKTFVKIVGMTENSEEVVFTDSEGNEYIMYHDQNCCESVSLESVCGNVSDLLNTPILMAEERTSSDSPEMDGYDSYTWTFYSLATIGGYVDLRWFGQSNGYYSEGVSIKKYN